ncbi:hypothetical protein ACFY93_32945 [Streptomyces sp. NPDC008313]|uniref:hypothetical protein n=1 Tax=Streptomyces sp. NPDC008313 TaxID=3364826 RepID=UPI0036EDC5A7
MQPAQGRDLVIWWMKARQIVTVLLPSLAAFTVLVTLGHNAVFTLPGLLSLGGRPVFLTQAMPLIITAGLAHVLSQGLPEAEVLATRKIRHFDLALTVSTVAAAGTVGIAVGAISGSQEATATCRNVLFLTGAMLTARAVRPQAATLGPVSWVFVVILLGYRDFNRPWPWAVTLHPPDYLPTSILSLLVFVCGLFGQTRTRPHV